VRHGSAIGAPVDEYVVGKNDKLVILASSVGTVIEWYDFYLYGSLAAIITVSGAAFSLLHACGLGLLVAGVVADRAAR
jgi:hypothetical protein